MHFYLHLLIFNSSSSASKTNSLTKIAETIIFRASFCDPFHKAVIELGDIAKDSTIDKFEKTPWAEILRKMSNAREDEIHYSPSLEIENKYNKHGLAFSAVDEPDKFEFYILYKRPKSVKSFLDSKKKRLKTILQKSLDKQRRML